MLPQNKQFALQWNRLLTNAINFELPIYFWNICLKILCNKNLIRNHFTLQTWSIDHIFLCKAQEKNRKISFSHVCKKKYHWKHWNNKKKFQPSIYFYIFNLRFFQSIFPFHSFNSLEDQTAWNFNNKSLRLECKRICVMSTKERKILQPVWRGKRKDQILGFVTRCERLS